MATFGMVIGRAIRTGVVMDVMGTLADHILRRFLYEKAQLNLRQVFSATD
jgi:hypothetical protein